MTRHFKTVDYEAALQTSVRLGDCLPEDHLARFVVDIVAQLDLKALYARYGNRGGQPYAPEILLGLLFYAYANGVFSSRKIEQAAKETAAYRCLAGNLAPDHDTIAWLLAHPAQIVPLVGSANPAHIYEFAGAINVNLSREDWYKLWVAGRGERVP